jgi:DNA-directed RNA polymerase subunit omega
MARITVEDCLQKVNNRFSLIHMASKRVRQLRKGAEPTISSKNRDIVIALREIAAGNVVTGPDDQPDLLSSGDDLELLTKEVSDQTDQPDPSDENTTDEQDVTDPGAG